MVPQRQRYGDMRYLGGLGNGAHGDAVREGIHLPEKVVETLRTCKQNLRCDVIRLLSPIFSVKQAFTLLELLVSMTIVLVLAGLIFPVYRASVEKSFQVSTANSLRSIGNATLLYANDNDGQLPGPFYSSFNAWYKQGDGSLGSRLYSYLGEPAPKTTSQEAKALGNLGNMRNRLKADSPVYLLNMMLIPANLPRLKPFGYAGDVPVTPPARLISLVNYKPSQTWAMQDADQQNPNLAGTTASWFSSLPKQPVNGSVRMNLFFDWHVEPVAVTK